MPWGETGQRETDLPLSQAEIQGGDREKEAVREKDRWRRRERARDILIKEEHRHKARRKGQNRQIL